MAAKVSTPDSRYIINNDHEGDVEAVSTKRRAFELAQQWADKDRMSYYVIDRMSHEGRPMCWSFTPTPFEDHPMPATVNNNDPSKAVTQTTPGAFDPEFCQLEDLSGRRCGLGAGHRGPHSFGDYRPTAAQIRALQDVGSVKGIRKLQCVGTTTLAPLKALASRGFIGLRYVNSRTYDAWMTPAGRRVLAELPR